MALNIQDLKISSADFEPGDRLADRFAGELENLTPALAIEGVPTEAVELAVIMHDPDAPLPQGFTHWTVYGIDPTTTTLGADHEIGTVGPNGMGTPSYFGMAPPPGHGTHHYYFWVYALNRKVEGTPNREEFLRDYADAIIEQNRIVGTYHR